MWCASPTEVRPRVTPPPGNDARPFGEGPGVPLSAAVCLGGASSSQGIPSCRTVSGPPSSPADAALRPTVWTAARGARLPVMAGLPVVDHMAWAPESCQRAGGDVRPCGPPAPRSWPARPRAERHGAVTGTETRDGPFDLLAASPRGISLPRAWRGRPRTGPLARSSSTHGIAAGSCLARCGRAAPSLVSALQSGRTPLAGACSPFRRSPLRRRPAPLFHAQALSAPPPSGLAWAGQQKARRSASAARRAFCPIGQAVASIRGPAAGGWARP